MGTTEWKRVVEVSELEIGKPKLVKLSETDEIAVVHTAEGIFAIANKCSHYGGPLSDGVVCGSVVTCPYHNARFDLRSGAAITPPALDDVKRYEVRIESGWVLVGAPSIRKVTSGGGSDARVFVIVGGGAAGNACSEMLRREGFGGRIVMISEDDSIPYDRPNLSKSFLSGEADPSMVPLRSDSFYRDLGIELMLETRVAAVLPGEHVVVVGEGRHLKYDALLLATGAEPRRLPGFESKRLFYLRSFGDSLAIVAAAEEAKRALVLGASFIGMEVAASLTARGIEVHLAAPEEVPMSLAFGAEIGRRFRRLHEENGVTFHLGTTLASLESGKREKATLSDETKLEIDLIVAGLGVTPRVGFLEGSGLVSDGAVTVDSRLRAGEADIYAAGDIARYPEHRGGVSQRIEHWSLAEMQGRHAATSMLGGDAPFVDTPFFWTRQFGKSFKYVGHAAKWERVVTAGSVDEGEFLTGYFREGTLRGAGGMGMQSLLVHLSEAMRNGESVSAEEFFELAKAV